MPKIDFLLRIATLSENRQKQQENCPQATALHSPHPLTTQAKGKEPSGKSQTELCTANLK